MVNKLLLTRSRHELLNQYLYHYSEDLIREANTHGWKVEKAEDENNTEKEVLSRITKNRPNFIIFNGHGNEGAIYGYKDQKIIDTAAASNLAKTIVFARSCCALKTLGKEAVTKDCDAFIGYNGLFILPHIFEYDARPPSENPAVKPVLEVSNMVGKKILKGDSVQDAVKAAKDKACELMLKTLASSELYSGAVFRALYQNDSTLDFEGKPNAKVQ